MGHIPDFDAPIYDNLMSGRWHSLSSPLADWELELLGIEKDELSKAEAQYEWEEFSD